MEKDKLAIEGCKKTRYDYRGVNGLIESLPRYLRMLRTIGEKERINYLQGKKDAIRRFIKQEIVKRCMEYADKNSKRKIGMYMRIGKLYAKCGFVKEFQEISDKLSKEEMTHGDYNRWRAGILRELHHGGYLPFDGYEQKIVEREIEKIIEEELKQWWAEWEKIFDGNHDELGSVPEYNPELLFYREWLDLNPIEVIREYVESKLQQGNQNPNFDSWTEKTIKHIQSENPELLLRFTEQFGINSTLCAIEREKDKNKYIKRVREKCKNMSDVYVGDLNEMKESEFKIQLISYEIGTRFAELALKCNDIQYLKNPYEEQLREVVNGAEHYLCYSNGLDDLLADYINGKSLGMLLTETEEVEVELRNYGYKKSKSSRAGDIKHKPENEEDLKLHLQHYLCDLFFGSRYHFVILEKIIKKTEYEEFIEQASKLLNCNSGDLKNIVDYRANLYYRDLFHSLDFIGLEEARQIFPLKGIDKVGKKVVREIYKEVGRDKFIETMWETAICHAKSDSNSNINYRYNDFLRHLFNNLNLLKKEEIFNSNWIEKMFVELTKKLVENELRGIDIALETELEIFIREAIKSSSISEFQLKLENKLRSVVKKLEGGHVYCNCSKCTSESEKEEVLEIIKNINSLFIVINRNYEKFSIK